MSAQNPATLAKVATSAAAVTQIEVPGRLSLRARGDFAPLNDALGLTLSTTIGQRSSRKGLEALCLGPDEWVLVGSDTAPAVKKCAAVYEALPHSLVDISGREITYVIDGARATELLTLGLPRDPGSIKVGEGRRTVFDGTAVVLWRDETDSYRMDIWNSFAAHVFGLLDTGCRELAAES